MHLSWPPALRVAEEHLNEVVEEEEWHRQRVTDSLERTKSADVVSTVELDKSGGPGEAKGAGEKTQDGEATRLGEYEAGAAPTTAIAKKANQPAEPKDQTNVNVDEAADNSIPDKAALVKDGNSLTKDSKKKANSNSTEDEDESRYFTGIEFGLLTLGLAVSRFIITLDNTKLATAISRLFKPSKAPPPEAPASAVFHTRVFTQSPRSQSSASSPDSTATKPQCVIVFTVGSGLLYTLTVISSVGESIGHRMLPGAKGVLTWIYRSSWSKACWQKLGAFRECGGHLFNTLSGAISVLIAQGIFSYTLVEQLPKLVRHVDSSSHHRRVIIAVGATHIRQVVKPQ